MLRDSSDLGREDEQFRIRGTPVAFYREGTRRGDAEWGIDSPALGTTVDELARVSGAKKIRQRTHEDIGAGSVRSTLC
ncbi:hypothetical protein EMEDMD4_1280008 [Sinorhizobium medicae]|uniref:Uncharacterized protein n=1 Tax=Sinorhizobium medicae TaxID=110321 RepID=A0A508WW08_9HYPH|nr:hypothetical protein EMEDMD4_1280008 [Sinorhizobium medicae]